MRLLLLSGGSGKRLWPMSNDIRSKQFLKVLKNDDGELESMLQRVCRQITSAGLLDSAIITAAHNQQELIKNQLGTDKVPVLLEPQRRDTFPAIALACTYLYSKAGLNLNEVVCVMPVDPYVEEEFFYRIKELENILYQSKANLVLMGVTPTFPATQYGYIIPDQQAQTEKNDAYMRVNRFIEKPNEEQAKILIGNKALWNCGIFAFKLGYLISILEAQGLTTDYDEFVLQYEQLPKNSFDYEVVEHEKRIVAVPYDGQWKDLGNWDTLTEHLSSNVLGNGIISEDSVNTHLINNLNLPVTIIGLSNIVAVLSPDGVLIADKTASPRIKQYLNEAKHRPVDEETTKERHEGSDDPES